jgi:hypothetical protein
MLAAAGLSPQLAAYGEAPLAARCVTAGPARAWTATAGVGFAPRCAGFCCANAPGAGQANAAARKRWKRNMVKAS